jgi:predicted transcriptional regulator
VKTSRQQLFDYIKNHHIVVTAEISRALNMTEANVRHHLTILQTGTTFPYLTAIDGAQP